MKLTAEISMYPFHEDYKTRIKDFIAKLNAYAELEVKTTATSTTVVGDYGRVMQVLGEMMEWSHDQQGRAVFVAKFIPGLDPR